MKSVIICDMEGLITNMNEGAEKVFGYPSDDWLELKEFQFFLQVKLFYRMFWVGLKMPTSLENIQLKQTLLEKMDQNFLLKSR
jgi:PAS domain-containing protein